MDNKHITAHQAIECVIEGNDGKDICSCEQCSARIMRAKCFTDAFREQALENPDGFLVVQGAVAMEKKDLGKKERKASRKILLFISGAVAACIALLFVFILNSGKEPKPVPGNIQGIVVFCTGKTYINSSPAKNGTTVKQGDILRADIKSVLTVQFGSSSIVTLGEKTTLAVDTLDGKNDKPRIMLDQRNGITFNKIRKGGADYSIRYGKVLAAVRGTSFTVFASEKIGRIQLLDGSVHLTDSTHPSESIDLVSGKKIEIDTRGIRAPQILNSEDVKNLKILDETPFGEVSESDMVSPVQVSGSAQKILSPHIELGSETETEMIRGKVVENRIFDLVVMGDDKPWKKSGISVHAGDRIYVDASGKVDPKMGKGPNWDVYGRVTPNGEPGDMFSSKSLLDQSAAIGQLLVRINGKIYHAGIHVVLIPSESGEIELCVNDEYYLDNSGSFNVTVMIVPSSARKLEDLEKSGGSLSVITTNSGKRYIGACTQNGEVTEIVTPEGKVSIPSKNIEGSRPYKL
jgi:hypothetical protein